MLIDLKTYLRSSASRIGLIAEDESGAAALEFGLVMPIFVALFFGFVELSAMNLHSRRAQQSVDFAAEYLSRDNDNMLTQEERWVAEDIWQIVNVTSFNTTGGDAYENSRGNYARSFAAADFVVDPTTCGTSVTVGGVGIPGRGKGKGAERGKGKKKGHDESVTVSVDTDCEYVPELAWSFLASQGISEPKRRTCDQTLVENNEATDETSLPKGVVSRGAIVIADFTYKYEPFFELGFIPQHEKHLTAIRMSRSGVLLDTNETSKSHMVYCDSLTGDST